MSNADLGFLYVFQMPSLLFLVSLLTSALGLYTWQYRTRAGAAAFSWLMFTLTWWSAGYALEITRPDLASKLLAARLTYLAIATAPVFWVVFCVQYIGRSAWLSRARLAALFAFPALTLLLVWTSDFHSLFMTDAHLEFFAGQQMLHIATGPAFFLSVLYSYALMLAGAVLLWRYQQVAPELYVGQKLTLLLSLGIPLVMNLFHLLEIPPFNAFDPTSIAFSLTCFGVAWSLFRMRLLETAPLARWSVVENMSDAVIVLDQQNRLIDFNPAAQNVLQIPLDPWLGKSAHALLASWPDLIALLFSHGQVQMEWKTDIAGKECIYDLRLSPVNNHERHEVQGRLLVWREITSLKQAGLALQRRSSQLQVFNLVIAASSQAGSTSEMLNAVLEYTLQGLKLDAGFSYLFQDTACQGLSRKTLDMLKTFGRGDSTLLANPAFPANISDPIDFLPGPGPAGMLGVLRVDDLRANPPGLLVHSGVNELLDSDVGALLLTRVRFGEQIVGALGVVSAQPRRWLDEEVALLTAIARQVGLTAERLLHQQQAAEHAELIERLVVSSELLAQIFAEQDVIPAICNGARQVCGANQVEFFKRIDPVDHTARQGHLQHLEIELARRILDNPQPLLANDLADAFPDLADHPELDAIVCQSTGFWPLTYQGRPLAVVACYYDQPHIWTEIEQEGMQTFCRQAAASLENARLYDGLQQQALETASLYRALSRLFNPGGDQRSVAEQITQAVIHEFSTAHCGVLLVDASVQNLVMIASAGYIPIHHRVLRLDGPGITVAAYHQQQPIYIPDVRQAPNYVLDTAQTASELALPLMARGRVIGVLNLEHPDIDAFNERSRRVMVAFAESAALALENALLFETANQRLRHLGLLNQITHASLSVSELVPMTQAMADLLLQLFFADDVFITLVDATRQSAVLNLAAGPAREIYGKLILEPGEKTLPGLVIDGGQMLVLENALEDSSLSPRLAHYFSIRSALGLPLVANQRIYGGVAISFASPHDFTPQEIQLAEQASAQVALALAKAESLELSQRRAHEADNLRLASEALNSELDLQQVLDNILELLERVVHFDSATMFLLEGKRLRAVSAKGLPDLEQILGHTFPSDNPLMLEVARRNEPLIVQDAQLDPRFIAWGETNYVRGWMGVPLVSRGDVRGCLTLDSRQPGAFDAGHAALAQAFASQAAVAIQNASLFSDVQHLAITDPLTGLYNRRGYTELGRREIERARRFKRPLAALLLDIDHFKQVNDTYGHSVGDEVLVGLASRCRARMREIDIIGRYGGEEIVILLPETDKIGARKVAEDLRVFIEQIPFETSAAQINITVSIGVAETPNGAMELETLIGFADVAMYRAKRAGRNRVDAY